MANLKDLIVSGSIRAISGVIGDLTGTADKALKDGNGNTITSYYIPTARTVNSKALSSNIVLNGADLAITGYSKPSSTSALAATDTINAALGKLEKALDGKQASGSYVPTSRTVNSKALTDNITLNYSDVGAAASSHTHTSSDITNLSSTISTAISGKADKATSLSGYGIADAYTKTEIDGKLSGAMHFKGTKASVSNLPTTGNVQGDMWNVTDTGANYAWDGSAWDKLSENIDLSGYVPTSRTVNGKALSGNISLTASDVGAATSGHTHSVFVKSGTGAAAGFVPAPSTTAGTTKYLREDGTWVVPPGTYTHPTTSGNKHIPSGGSSGQILKWSADGTATWAAEYSYTHPTTSGNKHIPSGGSSGQFLKWSADGTATWAADNDTKNTAGSTDTSSKIFLVGATSQAANPQTYSHDTVFVDTDGALNTVTATKGDNSTKAATTAFITTAIGDYVAKSGSTMTGTLVINKSTDAAGTANNSPALIVGGTATAAHLELDSNEIMAKTNGTSTAELYINNDGGLVHVGSGGLDVNGSVGMKSGAAKMQYNSTTEAIEFVFA